MPQYIKQPPHKKICLAQNVTSMDLEKPCVKLKLDCKIKHIRGGTKKQRGLRKIM